MINTTNCLSCVYAALYLCYFQNGCRYRETFYNIHELSYYSYAYAIVCTRQIKVQSKTSAYFASKASAMTPAASGADADVPVCLSVH